MDLGNKIITYLVASGKILINLQCTHLTKSWYVREYMSVSEPKINYIFLLLPTKKNSWKKAISS